MRVLTVRPILSWARKVGKEPDRESSVVKRSRLLADKSGQMAGCWKTNVQKASAYSSKKLRVAKSSIERGRKQRVTVRTERFLLFVPY